MTGGRCALRILLQTAINSRIIKTDGVFYGVIGIFIGIRGGVAALDRDTGQQLWKARLKGADFVNVMLDNDRVIAATKGEVFCLDAASGQVLWHSELPGQGWGLVTIATASGSSTSVPSFPEKRRRDETAAAASHTRCHTGRVRLLTRDRAKEPL